MARPVEGPERQGLPDHQGRVRHGLSAASTGTGLGLGNQDRIPYVETDFIFAVIAQELGLFGATLVIVAYLLMVGSGLRIAARSDHAFDKLLAVGLSTLLGVQAFIIIGGVIRLLPLTGVTLPFVSYGGSSLVVELVLLALLLRISDENGAPAPPRSSTAVDGRMNTQIRRLGIGLVVCYLALFVMLNWIQVVQQGRPRRPPAQHRPGQAASSTSRGARSPRPTGPLLAESVDVPDAKQFHLQRTYPEGRPVRPAHRLLLVRLRLHRPRAAVRRPSSPARPSASRSAASPTCSTRGPQVGNLTLTVRKDLQQVAKQALGERAGLGRGHRPPHRRAAGVLELPLATTRTWCRRSTEAASNSPGALYNADAGQAPAGPPVPGDATSPARRSRS